MYNSLISDNVLNDHRFLAAYFVQNVVSSYETHHAALQGTSQPSEVTSQLKVESEVLGKECSNLIVLISELYNFQVISSVLVFDIIRDLLDQKLTEFNVELLLKIVRSELDKIAFSGLD
jgi:nucleolar MIF4G domain-containing protein 1